MFFWMNLAAGLVLGGWYLAQPETRQAEVRRLVGNALAENKRVELADVAWDLWQLYYSEDYVAAGGAGVGGEKGGGGFAYGGEPRAGVGLPTVRVLRNTAYAVGYAEAWGVPVWAAYRVRDVTPLPAAAERPEGFVADGRTVARVSPEVYTGTGYDRGHLAPNFAIGTRHGAEAQRETFLMSNVVPQRHGLNAGLWKALEMRAATDWPARFGEVWVVAGPVFGVKEARLKGSGPRVPEAFFLIVADELEGRVRSLALILPQEPGAGAEVFLTTVDEVEKRTGLDFFAGLEDAAEAELEGKRAARVW